MLLSTAASLAGRTGSSSLCLPSKLVGVNSLEMFLRMELQAGLAQSGLDCRTGSQVHMLSGAKLITLFGIQKVLIDSVVLLMSSMLRLIWVFKRIEICAFSMMTHRCCLSFLLMTDVGYGSCSDVTSILT